MAVNHTYAEINLKALYHNLALVKSKTSNKDIIAVVKANAYGHGAVTVSKALIQKGISKLGVAFTEEAVLLRNSGIDIPILVFFDRDNIDTCLRYNLTPVLFNLKTARQYSAAARKKNSTIPVHIKVDTGMGRVGFNLESAVSSITRIADLKNIKLEGLMSHFSDADLEDKEYTRFQLAKFTALIQDLKARKIGFRHHHLANSAAILTMPAAHLNMVRPGIMLYGYGCCEREKLKPVLSLKSSIVLLKKVSAGTPISYGKTFITRKRSTIATIALGYADGYSRKLSNIGEVLIEGQRAPIAGRVCMDTIMVDVTHVQNVSYSSEVVLIGSQGRKKITADDIAEKTGTIPYEVLTAIGERVKRVYKK